MISTLITLLGLAHLKPEETLAIHFPATLEGRSNLRQGPDCTELGDRSPASDRTSPGEPENGNIINRYPHHSSIYIGLTSCVVARVRFTLAFLAISYPN